MNQLNNGETGSSTTGTVESQKKAIEEALDKYERKNGLAQIHLTSEADKYFAMSLREINELSEKECGNASYLLGQMAYNIQRAINKESGMLTWAKDKLPLLLAGLTDNYPGKSYEERKMSAIREHENLRKIYTIQTQCQQKIDTLNYLSSRIDNLSRILLKLQEMKRAERGY